jgi:hypothetical protein
LTLVGVSLFLTTFSGDLTGVGDFPRLTGVLVSFSFSFFVRFVTGLRECDFDSAFLPRVVLAGLPEGSAVRVRDDERCLAAICLGWGEE